MFTPPPRFCTPREHWPPIVSQRVDEIGNVSFLRPFIHVRSFHYIFGSSEPRPIGLHISRPRRIAQPMETPIGLENSKSIKSFFVALFLITGVCWAVVGPGLRQHEKERK